MFEPSVAFSHDGMQLAIPTFVAGDGCIAIYDVIADANSLLGNRVEVFWPRCEGICLVGASMEMAFSPTDQTLALAGGGRVYFIDVIGGTFVGWTRCYDGLDILALQYSPDGRFVAAAGNDLSSKYEIRFDGFIYMFNVSSGDRLWTLASERTGERLPGIDTLAFSSCSAKMACVESGCAREQLYIAGVDSGYLYHRLTMANSVKAAVFDPSGERLIIVHGSSICIIDSLSSAKLHESLFFDASLEIEAISRPEDSPYP